MTYGTPLETRVASLISTLADAAPTEVDAMAMSRLAAAGSHDGVATRFGFLPAGRLAFALLLLALVATMAGGALVAGRFLQRDAKDLLTKQVFVEPFTGLPPEGAPPSAPEQGELVLSFGGRVNTLGGDFHRMWLYADGRLLWRSNLEGRDVGLDIWAERFGGIAPTTAVIEQRLTPEGVDLIRSKVMASARVIGPLRIGEDNTVWSRPGVIWGGLTLGDGDTLLDAEWSDSRLPTRLAFPASWLPKSAWADRRIGGYVPSHYAMCVWPNEQGLAMARLPEAVQALARVAGTKVPGSGLPPGDCQAVTKDVARAIVAAFDAAGHMPAERLRGPLSYVLTDRTVPGAEITVDLLEITPHGEVICNCG
jgi:hypothetical protein